MRSARPRKSAGRTSVLRAVPLGTIALMTLLPPVSDGWPLPQERRVPELIADLTAQDPTVRARAACGLREEGDTAASAVQPLIALLSDASPVDPTVCEKRWWRGSDTDLVTPGELAASALVAIGTRTLEPLLATMKSQTWVARRNASWALGALDDRRATGPLVAALKDQEPGVREQAAWALGAIDDRDAVMPLIAGLNDADPRVRRQAAWALGAIDDRRAAEPLIAALKDADDKTRAQAAWALGA